MQHQQQERCWLWIALMMADGGVAENSKLA
jgi:hypothetical protein